MTNPTKELQRPDALLSPDMTRSEKRSHFATAPLDLLASEMEQKWGIDRLPKLVSFETAKRYGIAIDRFHEAMNSGDTDAASHAAAVCARGLKVMDEEATAAGKKPSTLLAEYKDGPHHFGIMADNADWKPIKAERPELTLYSLREVCEALKAFDPLKPVKDAFPGAEIGTPKPASKPLPKSFWENGGDEIPI